MTCKRNDCDNPVTGKSQYCSESCKTVHNRNKRAGTTQPEQASHVPVDGKCYNQPAVACPEFDIRPAPLDPVDEPVPMNRGRYKRFDGTVYQFDSKGQHFECQYPYKDNYGKPHLAVYETVADVRQAAGV